jgi:hypothetical protein
VPGAFGAGNHGVVQRGDRFAAVQDGAGQEALSGMASSRSRSVMRDNIDATLAELRGKGGRSGAGGLRPGLGPAGRRSRLPDGSELPICQPPGPIATSNLTGCAHPPHCAQGPA